MDLQHIAGNTYYINYPSIVGVYILADNSCILIDSGASPNFGNNVLKIIKKSGLEVYGIINTHFHGDHTGGNAAIQAQTNCFIYASPLDKVVIENPIFSPFSVYSAYPLEALKNKLVMANSSIVTHEIKTDTLTIKEQNFKIMDLGGHTMGQIGIITPDEVLFSGDAIISQRNLEKFPFLYMADLGSHIQSLEKLDQSDYPYVVLSHDGLVSEWRRELIADKNQIALIINIIINSLDVPKSREDIQQLIINQLDLPINTSQYFLISASISAYISYLCQQKRIKHVIEDKQVKFIRC